MIFRDVPFYENKKVDEDALGNPIYDEVKIGEYRTTITQWTSEEIALLDRSVTQNNRKLLTHAPVNVLKRANHVYVDGIRYTQIDVKSDYVRWRVCHVKEYKQ